MRQIHRSISLTDRSSVGEARRTAIQAADSLGFDEGRRNDIGIAATEAANNIIQHAQSGELLLCAFSEGASTWLDMIALDSGPGIRDIPRAMEDGYSTGGTAGQGLGAIERLSDGSSLYSTPGKGTAYWIRFTNGAVSANAALGVVSVPVKGERVCGDGFLVLPGASRTLYMVVDGLGHGSGAAEAAEEALAVVRANAFEQLPEIIQRSHDALKKTRGAAMSVAVVDHDRKILSYAGVGNISATLTTGHVNRSLVSQNGTLGAVLPRTTQAYTYPVENHSVLTMFSDGLGSKTGLSAYTGIQGRHPALIAGLLYRDFTRRRDDATVLVARMEG
ncbi:MAG TPA: ATP-binding SpoIIE family protein phosphatase [Acidobacteriaceae bacterium]